MMKFRTIAATALATLATGCEEVAAVATAPVIIPVMTVSAWTSVDEGPSIAELRQSSPWMAEDALMRALDQGTVGGNASWSNPSNPEGPARAAQP